jgi:hypothetical protein
MKSRKRHEGKTKKIFKNKSLWDYPAINGAIPSDEGSPGLATLAGGVS